MATRVEALFEFTAQTVDELSFAVRPPLSACLRVRLCGSVSVHVLNRDSCLCN
jgi:hypothetical protein